MTPEQRKKAAKAVSGRSSSGGRKSSRMKQGPARREPEASGTIVRRGFKAEDDAPVTITQNGKKYRLKDYTNGVGVYTPDRGSMKGTSKNRYKK